MKENILIICYSYSGKTRGIAEMIEKQTGGIRKDRLEAGLTPAAGGDIPQSGREGPARRGGEVPEAEISVANLRALWYNHPKSNQWCRLFPRGQG